MKKYFEATPNLDGLKEKIIVLKDGEKDTHCWNRTGSSCADCGNGRCGLSSENKNG